MGNNYTAPVCHYEIESVKRVSMVFPGVRELVITTRVACETEEWGIADSWSSSKKYVDCPDCIKAIGQAE